jgi:hypothetical protein
VPGHAPGGLAEAPGAEVERQAPTAGYESAADTVNIPIDEVSVKKQKAQRSEPMTALAAMDPPGSKRPRGQNTVARIEHAGQGFTLTGSSLPQGLGFVLAFLLNHALVTRRW